MKSILSFAVAAAALGLGGCAGQIPPGAAEMTKVPVVRYGAPAPADGDFILHYPVGAPLPIVATVDGSLLAKTGRAELNVTTNRDVYVYRQWVSFDGKTWEAGDKRVENTFRVTLPGQSDGRAPGSLAARFDIKP